MAVPLVVLLIISAITATTESILDQDEISRSLDLNSVMLIQDLSEKDTHFGYSLSLVRSQSKGTAGWIFIGAPKSNLSQASYEQGIVHRCSLENSVCHQIDLTKQLCSDGRGNPIHGSCNSSFMGSVMTNNDDIFVVCAPTWNPGQNSAGDVRMDGTCYWLNTSVAISENLRHDLETSVKHEKLVQYPTSSKKTNYGPWMFAGSGASAHITRSIGKELLLVGAPGVRRWNGTFATYKVTRGKVDSSNFQYFNPERFVFPEFTFPNYLGYSVSSGRYLNKDAELLAAGSPFTIYKNPDSSTERRMNGSVLIFKSEDSQPSKDKMWVVSRKSKRPQMVILGPQYGSYFGAAIESVDINGDDREELVVGAPFFYNEKGRGEEGDHGCVFIYSYKENWKRNVGTLWKHSQQLCGDISGSQFGMSIATLGDINGDGFNEFAVGAPYESKTGAVYIYFGRAENIPLQVLKIEGKRYDANFRSFGFSIVGNVDIDGNGTPDFAIGSYLDKSAVVFRTRPKLELGSKMSFYLKDPNENRVILAKDATIFHIQFCVSILVRSQDHSVRPNVNNMTIWANISIDQELRRFILSSSTVTVRPSSNIEFPIIVPSNPNQTCIIFNATRPVPLHDLAIDEKDIKLRYSLWYNDTKVAQPLSLVSFSADESRTASGLSLKIKGGNFTKFCPHCPYPTLESYSSEVLFARECKRQGDEGTLPVCQPDFEISVIATEGKSPNELYASLTSGNFATLGERPFLLLKTSVKNKNQTAYHPAVKLTWKWVDFFNKDMLSLSLPILNMNSLLSCKSPKLVHSNFSNIATCLLDPMARNRTRQLEYMFNMEEVEVFKNSPIRLEFEFEAYLDEENSGFMPIKKTLDLIYKINASVHVEGHELNTTLPITSINSLFYRFTIQTPGSTRTPLEMLFLLGSTIRYMGRTVKLLKIYAPSSELLQCDRFENASSIDAVRTFRDKTTHENLVTSCGEDLKNCQCFKCRTTATGQQRAIDATFKAEMLTSLPFKWKQRFVNLTGFGYASMFDAEIFSLNTSTIVIHSERMSEIDWWLYVAAAVGGLLLLAFIVLLLVKCGFFKRNTKLQLKILKEKAEMDDGFTYVKGPDHRRTEQMQPDM